MSFEQSTFKAFKDLFAADSTLVGLVKPGTFVHAEELPRLRTVPRIEFSMASQAADDSSGQRNDTAIVRLGVFVKRDLAHGAGATPEVAGQLEGIIDRMETVYNGSASAGVSLSASGWTFGKTGRARILSGPSTEDVVHRVMEFIVAGEKT